MDKHPSYLLALYHRRFMRTGFLALCFTMNIVIFTIHTGAQEVKQAGSNTNSAVNSLTNWNNALFESEDRELINKWPKGAATNGLFCGLVFNTKGSPVFDVQIVNTTTNLMHGWVYVPVEGSMRLDLIDAGGKNVAKTDEGAKIGTWTEREIKDWFDDLVKKADRRPIKGGPFPVGNIFPIWFQQASGEVSVPKMFQVTHPGSYQLHESTRVVLVGQDANRKSTFNIFWLPEVVAKIEIRAEDIQPLKVPSTGQTNAAVK